MAAFSGLTLLFRAADKVSTDPLCLRKVVVRSS